MKLQSSAFLLATLVACTKPAPPPVDTRAGDVAITVDDKGFTPNSVELKKGEPRRLVFKRTSEDTCATSVVFPELAIDKPLPLNQAVAIEIPTTTARTLTFQCGMAMYKSKVVVN